jgi:uncharacterized membrane protein
VTTQPDGAPGDDDPPQPPGEPESGAQELDRAENVVDGEPVSDDPSRPDRRLAWSASFSGPLPPPAVLTEYDQTVPGLAREIVDQWKAETGHRHRTIDGLREIDRESMRAYYGSERRGQWLALVVFLAVVAVAVLAIVLHREAVGVAAIVTGGASAIWAMRRRSDSPGTAAPPTDLGESDTIENPDRAR